MLYPGVQTFLALHHASLKNPSVGATSSDSSSKNIKEIELLMPVSKESVAAVQPWLIYWIMYSSMMSVTFFTDIFFFWMPFYGEFKFILLAYMVLHDARGATVLYERVLMPFVTQQNNVWQFIGRTCCLDECLCAGATGCDHWRHSSFLQGPVIRRNMLQWIRRGSLWLSSALSTTLLFCHATFVDCATKPANAESTEQQPAVDTHWSLQLAQMISTLGLFVDDRLDDTREPSIQQFVESGSIRHFLPSLNRPSAAAGPLSTAASAADSSYFKRATILQRAQVQTSTHSPSSPSSFEDLDN